MFRLIIGRWAALLALAAQPVSAQEASNPLPVEALLALAERPYLDGAQFEQFLSGILPSSSFERVLPEIPLQDPYLWFFMRTLDGQSSNLNNTLTCSRHGLATRAWFAENRNSTLESVLLESAISPLADDQTPWPEGAVALLHCELLLGEVDRHVSGLTEAQARAALSMFQTVTAPMEPETQTLVYGQDGYSVSGSDGKSNSIMQVHSAQLTRIANVQVFQFTTFLINS
jgi:hypothetical protein